MHNLHTNLDAFPPAGGIKLSELIGSLSYALDITEGQPPGHCMRCCWIGMHIGRELGLSEDQLWDLYYTLLLKDLGCSSNAARICELYLTDDINFKRDFKTVGESLPQVLKFVLNHTGLKAGLADRFRSVLTILRDGSQIARELIATRCQRGAEIARLLRFSEAVAGGIYSLDEHYNGQGKPDGLAGDAIPVFARIALMAQVIDVFLTADGIEAAINEVRLRSGRWFDPQLVQAFERAAQASEFWSTLIAPDIAPAVLALEPSSYEVPVDDDYLDDIAAAFGQVVDSKSPYTSGHSTRVAFYTDLIAEALGLSLARRRWLKRGALLHDVGKLGVSNSVLDKAGKLNAEEWVAVKLHATYTETILSRIGAFAELARVAGAHHERLDGRGYPRGINADEISLETRIITTADIFDAITADRPYRGPIPVPQALEMMAAMVGSAIDKQCFDGLKAALKNLSTQPDVPDTTELIV
ncbi:HD-GYP domain-containing protein [Glaciimonas sp. CA11.2]|uniref:HD-GYP domain-containing protein n=1 Tax=unclassified Glaciimonas TaxID=2644401 RepID=UPI002AB5D734|nr:MULTISPECIES: HD-GYP domain-containing protein [unclassified Glaciimonas]MDY7547359.1 HD-GYP domain-containing protein [Glaciimonas sp. CA11.2]MEB0012610.1 HD-GYP domain-containing protein [Glaciimonas sp. Cout2]MEB0083961.1 HD-GYP domain-containing protein [Glaciimonas sp. Gout2]MEB0164706.1 HD-GYP domain-containing protein [Glaciimonas sp. CA11.2]